MRASFGRWSTSAKLFGILTLALLPLGIVALLASLQNSRTADLQRIGDLRVAAGESSRKLESELISDIVVLAEAVRADMADPGVNSGPTIDPCARPAAIFAGRAKRPLQFAIFGRQAKPLCGSNGRTIERPRTDMVGTRPTLRLVGQEVELIVPARVGGQLAVVRYPRATLAQFAKPSGYLGDYRLMLDIGGATMPLIGDEQPVVLGRVETVSVAMQLPDTTLTMSVTSSLFTAADALLTFLPLLMWASASLVGFYVVDRVLVGPLKQLRADVASYRPGSAMQLSRTVTPAIEIDELRDSFAAFSDRLGARERQLETALFDQVRLTREVHHRVKNNLQVIASLISLHARGTTASTAIDAYATIQRRVDALAIVHRNHFAELEHSQGIDVRAMLGELATNFRANAVGGPAVVPITVAVESMFVGQDTAMPLAFLFTELAEQSLNVDPAASLHVRAIAKSASAVATLTLTSSAFVGIGYPERGSNYAARIIEGLARQLRSPLLHDVQAGSYAVDFPLIAGAARE